MVEGSLSGSLSGSLPVGKDSRSADVGISKGSYSHASYMSLRDMNNKSGNVPSPQVSRVNLSRLRLDSSAKIKAWKDLDDFNLEELRDGFFDPAFTKPEKHVQHDDKEVDNGLFCLHTIPAEAKQFIRYKELLNNFWAQKLSIFKYSVAFFISLVICVIHPSGKWIGDEYRYFLPIATLIHHPVRNIGVQAEMTIASVIGASFGLGWSALAWYISVATRPTAIHQGGVLFASLTLALLWSTWLRELYQRLQYITLSFSIAIIFLHNVSLVSSKQDLHWKVFWDFGISYLFGILLSLVVCVFVDPHSGNAELMEHFGDSITNIRQFLLALIDKGDGLDERKLKELQQNMVNSISVDLSEGYREFANQWTVSKFNAHYLKELRNSLTSFMSPLRALPVGHKLLDNAELEKLYNKLMNRQSRTDDTEAGTDCTTEHASPMDYSNPVTPLPTGFGSLPKGVALNSELYLSVLRSTFSKDIFALIVEMIIVLENMAKGLKCFEKSKSKKDEIEELNKLFNHSSQKLKRKIYNLDVCYKEFTKSNFFCKELLTDADSVDIFLFLRYLRNAAKHLILANENCQRLGSDIKWRIVPMHYPLQRALLRLPKQCSLDEGAANILHYFETKKDVDDIFERLYNAYTSRHQYKRHGEKNTMVSVRAIDHNDFNFHTTNNRWRFRLWKVSSLLVGAEMKWTIKILFVMIFYCLPGWIPESHGWYDYYQCWWAPLTFFLLAHRKLSGTWDTMLRRLGCALVGIFWGWAANQSRHFGSPYVICTFGGLIVIVFATNVLVYKNTKSSFTALMCFSVIALKPYSEGSSSLNTAAIWKNTWVTGLAFIIAVLTSVPVNWIAWSFKARSELRLSVSSLLAHLSQSYQSVTDRYLYRDMNDAPTELTLALSHIREVRLTQSAVAVRGLITKSANELSLISDFSPAKYYRLLDACDFLLEKIVEARISGSFFEIWNGDPDNESTRALLSLRRDSVSSVIFVFYILSNCYRTKNKIPMYLPNPMVSRKKLYDFLAELEMQNSKNPPCLTSRASTACHNISLEKKMFKEHAPSYDTEDYEKSRWTEIHGMAFARAFTDITEAMQVVVACSKDILGEEVV